MDNSEYLRGVQHGRKDVIEWIKKQELTEPDDDSTTRFYPFYTFREQDLNDKCFKDWNIRYSR